MPERTRWGAVAALFIAGVVAALQIGKASIAVPVLQRELLLSLVVASWVIGAYGVLGAVAGLPSGILASLFSARRTLIAGLLAAGLGSLAGALSTHGGLLILTRIIEGCGFLAAVLALPRLLGAVTAPKDRDTVFAIWGAYMPVGSLVMLLGGPQLLAFGWQSLWVVNGVVAIVYAALVALLPLHEEMHAGNPGQALLSNIKQALGSSGPVLLALAFGVYTFQYSALAGLLPTLLVDRMGLSVAVAGAISAATVAANAIGNLAAGALLRFGAKLWAIAAISYCFVGGAALGIFSENVPVYLIAALASASLAVTGLIPASIFAAAPRFAQSSALLAIVLGLINQASNLGSLFGPAAIASVVQRLGWAYAPMLFFCVTVSGVTIALLLRRAMNRARYEP